MNLPINPHQHSKVPSHSSTDPSCSAAGCVPAFILNTLLSTRGWWVWQQGRWYIIHVTKVFSGFVSNPGRIVDHEGNRWFLCPELNLCFGSQVGLMDTVQLFVALDWSVCNWQWLDGNEFTLMCCCFLPQFAELPHSVACSTSLETWRV